MAEPVSTSYRVLCLTLHPGASGHAVLDGYGVQRKGFFSTRYLVRGARTPLRSLRLLLKRSLLRYRPHCVVLGIADADVDLARELRDEARRIARAARVSVVTRWLREGRLLIANRTHLGVEQLARRIAEGFLPDLGAEVQALRKNVWYRRPAWDALALALVELTHRRPRVAAALATSAARFPSFWKTVARCERGHHPIPV